MRSGGDHVRRLPIGKKTVLGHDDLYRGHRDRRIAPYVGLSRVTPYASSPYTFSGHVGLRGEPAHEDLIFRRLHDDVRHDLGNLAGLRNPIAFPAST